MFLKQPNAHHPHGGATIHNAKHKEVGSRIGFSSGFSVTDTVTKPTDRSSNVTDSGASTSAKGKRGGGEATGRDQMIPNHFNQCREKNNAPSQQK